MSFNNNYFAKVKLDKKYKELEKLRAEVLKNNSTIELETYFVSKIEKLLELYTIDKDMEELFVKIIFNYFNIINMYFIQKEQKIPKCDESIKTFLNVSVRVLEFAIITNNYGKKDLEKLYFNTASINRCFFQYFILINKDISKTYLKQFRIHKDRDNGSKPTIFIEGYNIKYVPILKTRPPKKNRKSQNIIFEIENNFPDLVNGVQSKFSSKINWFEFYFKLTNFEINEIFNARGSRIHNRPSSKRDREKIEFDTFDYYECLFNFVVSNINYEDIESSDERSESLSREIEINSLAFNDEKFPKFSKVLKEKNVSNFKRLQIAKAISNNMAKKELFLKSKTVNDYILSDIVKKMISNNNYYEYILIISIFIGVEVKNLLYILTKQSKFIVYTKNSLRFNIDANSFADSISRSYDITKEVENDYFEVYLPSFLNEIFKYVKKELKIVFEKCIEKDYISNLELYKETVENEFKNIKNALNKQKDNFGKNIPNFNIKTIHKTFYYYFYIYNDKSDIGILTNQLTRTNDIKARYAVRLKRLYHFEKWINDFYNILTNNHSASPLYDEINSKYAGSPKFIASDIFIDFILSLKMLKTDDEIQKLNLLMIIIRYSLSILIAGRDIHHSCDLSNCSIDSEILIIHEKAKSINSSRRLIPLTNLTLKFIKYFHELKNKYQIKLPYPVLLIKSEDKLEEHDITKKSIIDFLHETFKETRLRNIEKFIQESDLNFGRHIFTSKAVEYSFNNEFTDEFMGHYSKAKLGLGIYSNFNVGKYLRETREFVEKIEKEYFPECILIEDLI